MPRPPPVSDMQHMSRRCNAQCCKSASWCRVSRHRPLDESHQFFTPPGLFITALCLPPRSPSGARRFTSFAVAAGFRHVLCLKEEHTSATSSRYLTLGEKGGAPSAPGARCGEIPRQLGWNPYVRATVHALERCSRTHSRNATRAVLNIRNSPL